MHRAFPPLTEARQRAEGMSVIGADACMITYALAHINNNPPVDRDTWRSIVLSCNYASFLAVDTFVADTIKKTCFDWSLSSMGAIPGRYTGKSLRKMWDWASHRCQEGREAGNPVGLGTLYRIAVEKGMNMQRALAVWNEYAGKEMDEATERAELYRMTSNG